MVKNNKQAALTLIINYSVKRKEYNIVVHMHSKGTLYTRAKTPLHLVQEVRTQSTISATSAGRRIYTYNYYIIPIHYPM